MSSAIWLEASPRSGCSATGSANHLRYRPRRVRAPHHAHLVYSGFHGRPLVLLLGVEERLHVEATVADLATDPAPTGSARPAGYRLLEEYRLDPWPIWRYRSAGVTLEKSLFIVYGHHAAVIRYRHRGGPRRGPP